jgi:hypothetical protein
MNNRAPISGSTSRPGPTGHLGLRRAHRPATANKYRSGGHRLWPGAIHSHQLFRELRHRGAPRSRGIRPGLAITVASLTSTVLAAVPASHAGMASAVNNDVARAASLIAVAVIPAAAGLTGTAYVHPAQFSPGFGRAWLISAGLCLAGGVLAAVTIRNPVQKADRHSSCCIAL